MGTDLQTNSTALSIVILLPAIVCVAAFFFWPPPRMLRNVVIPTLMFFPGYFYWKIKLLPPVHFADAVFWPLGIAMLLRSMPRWRFSIIDLWVVLFVVSSPASDFSKGRTTNAIFELFEATTLVLFPYMAGKLLVEQDGGRLKFIERFLLLSCLVAVVGSMEWKWLYNPFERLLNPFFLPGLPEYGTQIRNGHGRVSAAFFSGELAGTVWIMALLLAVYAARYYGWGMRRIQYLRWHRWTLFSALMLVVLYFTQSRGPELGFAFAAPIAWVGRTRKVARNALLVAVVMVVGGTVAFTALSSYAAAGATKAPTSDEQETAAYRIIMIGIYLPSAENGGFVGQGRDFPRVGKYISIDNEYLLVWLEQGYLGLGSFLLVSLGTIAVLVRTIRRNPAVEDRALAFTLLAILVAILIDVATVYLGLQPEAFFFLMVGWAQAIGARPERRKQPVFEQVYT